MEFQYTIRLLVGILFSIPSTVTIKKAIDSYQDGSYGVFAWCISMTVLTFLLMTRMVFIDTF